MNRLICTQKLLDKGYDEMDIYYFLMFREPLNYLWLEDPRWFVDKESESYKERRRKEAEERRKIWEEISIEIDYTKHK